MGHRSRRRGENLTSRAIDTAGLKDVIPQFELYAARGVIDKLTTLSAAGDPAAIECLVAIANYSIQSLARLMPDTGHRDGSASPSPSDPSESAGEESCSANWKKLRTAYKVMAQQNKERLDPVKQDACRRLQGGESGIFHFDSLLGDASQESAPQPAGAGENESIAADIISMMICERLYQRLDMNISGLLRKSYEWPVLYHALKEVNKAWDMERSGFLSSLLGRDLNLHGGGGRCGRRNSGGAQRTNWLWNASKNCSPGAGTSDR